MRSILILCRLAAAITLVGGTAQASFSGPDEASKADRDATLSLVASSYPKTLNPILSSTADEAQIVKDFTVFDQVVRTDPDNGEAVCWLCESFSFDDGEKKVLTVKLRKDAQFHDGKPLTAHDVKFTFDVVSHPKVDNLNLKSTVSSAISRVEVIDDYTLKVYFRAKRFTNVYALEGMSIIPKHLFPYFEKSPEQFNKDQKFGRKPLGSGPYKFLKWDGDKLVELERNDNWWGFKDPRFKNAFNFKKVRFKFVTNDNVQMQAFKKGDFDLMQLQSFQFDELKKSGSLEKIEAFRLSPKISNSFGWIAWNMRKPIFADVKTREALGLLTDRKSTLEKFSKGLRPQTNGPWGIKSDAQCPVSRCPIEPFNPSKAKDLLKSAGWADSDKDGCLDRTLDGQKQDLKFTFMAGDGDYYKNVLGVYVTEMKKAGVCAEIRQLDWTATVKLVDELNFDAYFSGWQTEYPIMPRQLFHSESAKKTGSNVPGYIDPESDKLIDQYEGEFDEMKRLQISRALHERIYNAHPVVWHHEGGGCFFGRRKDLLGVEVAPFYGSCTFWPRWYKVKS
jgi:ABC-type transport system substrate-binding protein